MRRLVRIVIIVTLLVAEFNASAQAVDLSARYRNAMPTRERYSMAGAIKTWKGPGAVNGIKYDSTGWERGLNTEGMWVNVFPDGRIPRAGKCGNQISLVVCKPKPICKAAPTESICASFAVERGSGCCVANQPPSIPVPNVPDITRQIMPGVPINYGTKTVKDVEMIVPFFFTLRQPTCTVNQPPDTCPGVNPPPKPVASSNPSGGGSPVSPNGPPPANPGGHVMLNTPPPSGERVADRVVDGNDGFPIR